MTARRPQPKFGYRPEAEVIRCSRCGSRSVDPMLVGLDVHVCKACGYVSSQEDPLQRNARLTPLRHLAVFTNPPPSGRDIFLPESVFAQGVEILTEQYIVAQDSIWATPFMFDPWEGWSGADG
jgi:ribosomal protein L37E